MTNKPLDWEFTFHSIIPHRDEPRILMLEGEQGWGLPAFRTEGPRRPSPSISQFTQAVRDLLGIYTTMLRMIDRHIDRDAQRRDYIYVLENHSPGWNPIEGTRWVNRKEISQLSLETPQYQEILESVLFEAESGEIPRARPPWQRTGWIREAVTWIQERLTHLGYRPISPAEQFRNWEISSILRIHTSEGLVYFKQAADLPLFSNEPAMIDYLADVYPNNVPKPIAIDRERRWMLLRDFGKVTEDEPFNMEPALVRFGEMQLDSVERIDELLAAGCIDRRLSVLESQIDAAFVDEETISGLSPSEAELARAIAPRFKEMCQSLSQYNVPETLIHSDLHAGNIALTSGNYTFFDWTDSSISHPFFDLVISLGEETPIEEMIVPESYLSLWEKYETRERLLEMWSIARTLGMLHQLISYQNILPNLDWTSHMDMKGIESFFLKRALKSATLLD